MQITGRNLGIWQISQDKNVSEDVPLKMRFYLPPTANGLRNMPLSYSITDFESYTGVTDAQGTHNHTVSIPDHNHTFGIWSYDDANSSDLYAVVIQQVAGEWQFVTNKSAGNAVTSSAGGGTSTTSSNSDSHTHNVTAELGTTPYVCDYISISVDGTDITPNLEADYGSLPIPDAVDLDIYHYLSTPVLNTWHEIIITPRTYDSTKALCYMYAYLSPEMTGAGI